MKVPRATTFVRSSVASVSRAGGGGKMKGKKKKPSATPNAVPSTAPNKNTVSQRHIASTLRSPLS